MYPVMKVATDRKTAALIRVACSRYDGLHAIPTAETTVPRPNPIHNPCLIFVLSDPGVLRRPCGGMDDGIVLFDRTRNLPLLLLWLTLIRLEINDDKGALGLALNRVERRLQV
jgi:hypothetical protein